MDKRYQVFVSSTFKDLEEERKHIIQTLMEMDCIPAGMELFPAADEEQWDFIKKVIDDCDYYLLLIGGRYGSLSPEGIGYTEMEYDYAVSNGIKVIALVHGEPTNLPQLKCEKDSILQEKLENFRNKVCTGRLVKFWTSKDQVAGIVALSLTKTIKMHPAVGWVRANLVPTKDVSDQILKLREKIKELEDQINILKFKPDGLDHLAQGLDIIKLEIIVEISNYFESINESHSLNVNTNWNKLFQIIAPAMIVECNETILLRHLVNFLKKTKADQILELLPKNIENISTSYKIPSDDFYKIIIQLRALKLISLSNKKHPPSDNNIYWSLTPYGDQLMTELNAIQKFK